MEYKYHNIKGAKFFTVSECLDEGKLDLLHTVHTLLYDNDLYEKPTSINSATDKNQKVLKNNLSVFLSEDLANNHNTIELLKKTVQNQVEIGNKNSINAVLQNVPVDEKPSADSVYSIFDNLKYYAHLLSYYNEDQSNYNTHHDHALFTFLMWFDFDDNFEGGDFTFPDFDLSIPAKHNTGVFFPGQFNHKVEDVVIKDKSKMGRLTYTLFKGWPEEE